MSQSARRGIAGFGIVVWLIVYVVIVVELAARLPLGTGWIALVFYVVAGLAWVVPLRPVMRWMTRADA